MKRARLRDCLPRWLPSRRPGGVEKWWWARRSEPTLLGRFRPPLVEQQCQRGSPLDGNGDGPALLALGYEEEHHVGIRARCSTGILSRHGGHQLSEAIFTCAAAPEIALVALICRRRCAGLLKRRTSLQMPRPRPARITVRGWRDTQLEPVAVLVAARPRTAPSTASGRPGQASLNQCISSIP